MMTIVQRGALLGLLIAAGIFILGPAVVGAFDLLCWFATTSQCTTVVWNEWRLLWAVFPVVVGFFAFCTP